MSDKITPLEYLCSVYRNKDLPLQMRFGAAMSVAPYMHPRLEAADVKIAHAEKPWWQDEKAAARARAAIRAVGLGWDDEPRPSPPVLEHKPASAGAEPSVSAEPGTSTEAEANKASPLPERGVPRDFALLPGPQGGVVQLPVRRYRPPRRIGSGWGA
jgi:hypothetical protein